MSTESKPVAAGNPYSSPSSAPPAAARPMRVWPAIILIAAYWVLFVANKLIDTTISNHFFTSVGGPGLVFLLFFIWWLTSRGIPFADRLIGFGAMIAGSVLASLASHPSIGWFTVVVYAMPAGLTLWTIWLALGGRRSAFVKRWGAALSLTPLWIGCCLIRMNGLDSNLQADIHARWTLSPEELLVAEERGPAKSCRSCGRPTRPPSRSCSSRATGRGSAGPSGTAKCRGLKSRPIGKSRLPSCCGRPRSGRPGRRLPWSAIACSLRSSAATTNESFVSTPGRAGKSGSTKTKPAITRAKEAPARGELRLSTPDGSIRCGATGILNCLDAATGELKWTHNALADANAPEPMWGVSASPLVVNGIVIVYAGGTNKGLLGYRAADGTLAWTAATGTSGYSSGQLVSIGGTKQVLAFDDGGVVAVDPASGTLLWRYAANGPHTSRTVQPHLIGDSQVLFGSEDLGLVAIDVQRGAADWTATRKWTSKGMYPAYNDFVVQDGAIYGFDKGVFCCLDAATGKRLWKGGHYGQGQVLLLTDQRLLLVLEEHGEAALVAANSKKFEELGKFQALDEKVWNHPVVAHGRLYVRNDQEMACYQLTPAAAK